jgi:hypothetical protein
MARMNDVEATVGKDKFACPAFVQALGRNDFLRGIHLPFRV